MKGRSIAWLGAMALAAACSVQTAFADVALPAMHQSGNIAYLSGGIGSDQSSAIKRVMHRYPLTLEFVGKRGDYLADVPVRITDMHGATLLKTQANGPFMLLQLPDGHYQVSASYDGNTLHRDVTIGSGTRAHEMFVWPS
jgi:hypothetical protein